MFSSGIPDHVTDFAGIKNIVLASLDCGISELVRVASLYTYMAW